jgi:hypothetical protein
MSSWIIPYAANNDFKSTNNFLKRENPNRIPKHINLVNRWFAAITDCADIESKHTLMQDTKKIADTLLKEEDFNKVTKITNEIIEAFDSKLEITNIAEFINRNSACKNHGIHESFKYLFKIIREMTYLPANRLNEIDQLAQQKIADQTKAPFFGFKDIQGTIFSNMDETSQKTLATTCKELQKDIYVYQSLKFSLFRMNIKSADAAIEFAEIVGMKLNRIDITTIIFTIIKFKELIEKLPCLTTLVAGPCLLTDDFLEVIAKSEISQKLNNLDLSYNSEITDAGLKYLGSLENLIELDLKDCEKITDEGLKYLGSLKNLKKLNLKNCHQITDKGIKSLAGLSLQSLEISCMKLIRFENLAQLNSLKFLSLYKCTHIDGVEFKKLKSLDNLTLLKLNESSNLTNIEIEHLASLSNLQTLSLYCCTEITIEGLKNFNNLQNLQIEYCRLIKKKDCAALLKSLPKCNIRIHSYLK